MEISAFVQDVLDTAVNAPHAEAICTTENPEYERAARYVTEFFNDQQVIWSLLVDVKETGLQQFTRHSGAEYNQSDQVGLDLLLSAFELIPLAKMALGSLKTATKVIETLEIVGSGLKAGESAAKAIETADSKSRGVARVELLGQVITKLSDIRIELALSCIRRKRESLAALDRRRCAAGKLLLDVQSTLGPLPPADEYTKTAMARARDQFEISLYRTYYAPVAYIKITKLLDADVPDRYEVVGIPRGVLDRIRVLLGVYDDTRAVEGWNLPLRTIEILTPPGHF